MILILILKLQFYLNHQIIKNIKNIIYQLKIKYYLFYHIKKKDMKN